MTKTVYLLSLALLMSGCASSGTKISRASAEQFLPGISTCDDVRTRLGDPNIVRPSNQIEGDTVWIYSYGAAQAHPENFIPIVGSFAGGYDREATMAAFRFNGKCVLDGRQYAAMNSGSGVNFESVGQQRKDTRSAQ